MLVVALSAGAADADRLDNWPHWRGPRADGSAPRATPPLKWDATTNVKWKTPIPGRGAATPIIWGDLVFVLSAEDTGRKADPKDIPKPDDRYFKNTEAPDTYHRFLVLAVERKTGKVRWHRTAAERVPHEGIHPTHSYAGGSPTTDGNYLYVSFGSFGVFCYDFAGRQLWKYDPGRMETRFGWGEASTPVVHGDTVVLTFDQEGPSFFVALDARTGKERWKAKRDEETNWSTPLVVDYKGKTQVVVNGARKVRSYDLNTGKLLWECGGQTALPIPSPLRYNDSVICMSGYKGAFAAEIRLDSSGDVTGTDKVPWTYKRDTPYVPSAALAGDRLYFTQMNNAILTCLNARTGKQLDRVRLKNINSFYASPVAAAGKVYLVGRDGAAVVVEQGDKIKVLAVNRLGEPVDASPAMAGKQLFLRGAKHLYCIEE
jgi:outer membrane protein assembly factor BamB